MKKLFPICLLLLLLLLPATVHAMDFTPEEGANSRLSERLQEVKLENKSLRCTSADYAQLKQILGADLWYIYFGRNMKTARIKRQS